MAYDFNYKAKKTRILSGDERTNVISNVKIEDGTMLRAKFRFGWEVAQNDRRSVCDRTLVRWGDGELSMYLKQAEGLYYVDGWGSHIFKDEKRKVVIYIPIWRLGIDLKVESEADIPFKEIFDLKRLNHFCLTGERRLPEGG